MQSIFLIITSKWNNEVLLSDININTNYTNWNASCLKAINVFVCMCLFPFVFNWTILSPSDHIYVHRFKRAAIEQHKERLTNTARGRRPLSRVLEEAQLMRRHGNSRSLGVFPPSIFVKSLMFLSTRTFSEWGETKRWKMSDILCKWLNEEVRISLAIGKYVQTCVELRSRLMLAKLQIRMVK